MKTYVFETVDPVMNKIQAIKLVREFTLKAFGYTASLLESKKLVENIAEAQQKDLGRKEIQDAVIVLLKALPIGRRNALLANLAATTFNGQPNFNQFDPAYDQYKAFRFKPLDK